MNIENIVAALSRFKKVGITLDELIELLDSRDYLKVCDIITKLSENGIIEPVKTSGTNGRNPPLYKKYRIVKKVTLSNEIKNEINTLHYSIDTSYLMSHPEIYISTRELLLSLSDYLKHYSDALLTPLSENERAYEIWGNEKTLDDLTNIALLKKCIPWELLNTYSTPEPFFEHRIISPAKTILVCENKDTWFTIRKLITEENYSSELFNIKFDSLIYSEGNKVTQRSNSLSDYLSISGDFTGRVYYWGDIDYEGIRIFLGAAKSNPLLDIIPFSMAYKQMVMLFQNKRKVAVSDSVLQGHQNQKRPDNITSFYDMLDGELSTEIDKLLTAGFYIPQEIINGSVLRELMVRKFEK